MLPRTLSGPLRRPLVGALCVGTALLAAHLLPSCSQPATEAPLRSPSLDYGREPKRDSDGTVRGADGIDPADRVKLKSGWTVDENGRPRFDREKMLGEPAGGIHFAHPDAGAY